MKSEPKKLLKMHKDLTQSDVLKVISHVQRKDGDWILNTLMIENCDTPFKYKRKKAYKNLTGQRVNLTYYPSVENVAGFDLDIMSVVRVKIS